VDTIVGLSVLQPTWIDGIYRLWFTGLKGSGERSQGWIFIREASRNDLPAKMPDYPDGVNSIWKFTRGGTRLDCAPSVNWISWGFHNAGSWQTEYVEMNVAEKAEDRWQDIERKKHGSAIHHDLNLNGGMNLVLAAELRQEGVLR